jgi:hypothetical protein
VTGPVRYQWCLGTSPGTDDALPLRDVVARFNTTNVNTPWGSELVRMSPVVSAAAVLAVSCIPNLLGLVNDSNPQPVVNFVSIVTLALQANTRHTIMLSQQTRLVAGEDMSAHVSSTQWSSCCPRRCSTCPVCP